MKIIKKYKKIFLCNWLFRNPQGLSKYHKKIIDYFKPQKKIQNKNKKLINNLKSNYKHIVGVHIRQGDYKKKFKEGKLYFNEKEVNIILNEYLEKFKKNIDKTCFVICSDENVELNHFTGINVIKNNGNAIEDLFLLSATDVIIGSDSTFGAFASYYGNIPFIVFQRNKIDWKYYINRKLYFENKYLTTVHY
ncbi:alpha-1,2-fucosyltransferase [Candidatus Parcubacteria bacterium]|nr:alpha-1,2-fucosyltransferase [Candidatus Parcubacteria bacterium]